MPNPFHLRPKRPFDAHLFEQLGDFLDDNKIDWQIYLRELLAGLAPAPIVYGGSLYVDRADTSLFRERLVAESLRRLAELIDKTEILTSEAT